MTLAGTPFLALSFANPALLPFFGLALIPIVIYLFNRQRYRRVPWAAMEFLLRAMKKNRRRLRVENLLLLIVRTLVVLFLVGAIVRPIFEDETLAEVAGRSQRAELYVLDTSYSMALESGGRSLFSEAKDRIGVRVDRQLEPTDVFGIVAGGSVPVPLSGTPQYVGENGAASLDALIDPVELAYEEFGVAAAIDSASSWINSLDPDGRALAWELHLYSDLQARDWLDDDQRPDTSVRAALDRLLQVSPKSKLTVHPIGPSRVRNATVVDIEAIDQILAVDMPTRFITTIRNASSETLAGLELDFEIEDDVQASKSLTLEPGETEQVAFPYVFREVGDVRVAVRLRSDELAVDNVRYGVFPVREAVEVLVVDGGDSADWLTAALDAESSELTGIRLTPYRTRRLPADRFLTIEEEIDQYDAIVLADVARLSAVESRVIRDYVRRGGGVIAFVGERVEPSSYPTTASGEDGWFPLRIASPVVDSTRENFYGLEITVDGHPSLRTISEDPDAGFTDTAVHGYWTLAADSGLDDRQILVRLTDFLRTPFIVERRVGEGRVIAVNGGADRAWSNWPVSPSYLIFLYEALPYLAIPSGSSRNLEIGEPFRRLISSEEYRPSVFVYRPDGSGLRLAPTEINEKTFEVSVPGQNVPGFFDVNYSDESGSRLIVRSLAVNAVSAEGDLQRIDVSELANVHPILTVERRDVAEAEIAGAPPSGEIWRLLIYCGLGLLLLESILARSFVRSKPRVQAAAA